MKQKNLLLEEAKAKFPEAVSEVEAIDLLMRQTNKEAFAILDKESERYQMAMLKYQKAKTLYRKLVREHEFVAE